MSPPRRLGGSAARKILRAQPLPDDQKPVRPGQLGGSFRPLSEAAVGRVHEAALKLLEEVGLSRAPPSAVEYLTKAGGKQTSDGRILLPRALVEDTIARAARNITLHAQDPKHDLDLSGYKVHFGTAGAAVHVVDEWKTHADYPEGGAYRPSTLQDLYDAARLVDHHEHIHFFQRCMVARDVEPPSAMDLNTTYATISGTAKHCGVAYVEPEHAEQGLQMLHMVAGNEKAWRARPFASLPCCFVVPPFRLAPDACRVMEVCVRGGMPILMLAAGQAGATSPASLAGAVTQEVAECLGCLVYVNSIVPGHPAIFGPWPFVSDLRTGAMSGGSGEQSVLMAACGQMGRFYDLPTGIAAGMTDAKPVDVQHGAEKGYTLALAGNSGANLVYESAGMQASLLGFSFTGCTVDNDILAAVNRGVRGLECELDDLSVPIIDQVCREGPEHFLSHTDTLTRMQRDYVYPDIFGRETPSEWQERGSPSAADVAAERTREILARHYPAHIPEETDVKLRAEFDVRLPRELMKAINNE